MLRYILFRLGWLIPTVFAMSIVVFVIMHATPGSPLDPEGGNNPLPEEAQKNLAAKYGLDKPLWQQYVTYVANAVRFDFGESYRRRDRAVKDIIADGLGVSLHIGLMAMAIAITGGVTLGMVAAARQNGIADYICTAIATLGVSLPNFVIAIVLIAVFVLRLHWIPRTGGWESPIDWVLPTIALSLGPLGIISRYVRSSMIEVIRSDYVRTARAKGASERRVVTQHVLKNALIPPLTVLGPIMAAVLTGSPAVEFIFRVPGIGRYFVESLLSRDYPMIMAVILLYGVFLSVMNLVVDVLYGVVDPRIRY
jgi:ABC-type dipeptide/oligopeptide/nickel transport system permease component